MVGINTFLTTDSETNTSNFYATAIDYAIEELDALGVSYHLQSAFPLGSVLLVTGVVVLLAAAAVVVTLMVKKRGAAAPVPFVEPVAPPAQPVASTEPIFQAPPVPPQAPKPQFMVGEGGLMDGKRYPLIPQGILFGRDPSCRICYLPPTRPASARKHCQVFWQGGHLMMMDLGFHLRHLRPRQRSNHRQHSRGA